MRAKGVTTTLSGSQHEARLRSPPVSPHSRRRSRCRRVGCRARAAAGRGPAGDGDAVPARRPALAWTGGGAAQDAPRRRALDTLGRRRSGGRRPGRARRRGQHGGLAAGQPPVGRPRRSTFRSAGWATSGRCGRTSCAPGASPAPPRTLSAAGAPPIILRPAWGAPEAIRRDDPEVAPRVRITVVHHTAGTNSYTRAQSAAIVRGIMVYHVQSNGWDDIGYNFLVDRYGQVFEGRYGGIERNVVGAHAGGFNTGTVGIAVIGSYGASKISAAAQAALTKLIAWRMDVAHADPLALPPTSRAATSASPRGRRSSCAASSATGTPGIRRARVPRSRASWAPSRGLLWRRGARSCSTRP